MKRREFLTAAAGVAGTLVPALSRGQTKPCPPPTVGVQGGTTAASSCAASGESDWLYRTQTGQDAAGVVWYHDFRNAAEVDYFRFTPRIGTEPSPAPGSYGSYLRHVSSDGITGGAVEYAQDAGMNTAPQWWRPFAALNGASNGRGVNDPAAGKPIRNRTVTSNAYAWGGDLFGHSDFGYYGTDFWLQVRLKASANFVSMGEASNQKILYFDWYNGAGQEIIITEKGNKLSWYSAFGAIPMHTTNWNLPTDEEWFTLLFHVIPGHENTPDTGVEVWAHKKGESGYTLLNSTLTYSLYFDDPNFGWNQIKFAPLTGIAAPAPFWVRMSQIIFSTKMIPCPQDGEG